MLSLLLDFLSSMLRATSHMKLHIYPLCGIPSPSSPAVIIRCAPDAFIGFLKCCLYSGPLHTTRLQACDHCILRATNITPEAGPILLEADCMKFQPFFIGLEAGLNYML